MKKRQRHSLPGTAGFERKETQSSAPESEPTTQDVTESDVDLSPETSEVAIPVGKMQPEANTRPLHLDIHLTREQSQAVRVILIGLRSGREVCKASGGRTRLVDSHADVIRWLLEQV